MIPDHIADVTLPCGTEVPVALFFDGARHATTLYIDGVPYHLERIPREELTTAYCVDDDPDYEPQCDGEDHCMILAPYMRQ